MIDSPDDLRREIIHLNQSLFSLRERKGAIEQALESVRALETIPDGQETLTTLDTGILVKTSWNKPETVFVNIGASVIVEKPVSDAMRFLSDQLQEVQTTEIAASKELAILMQQYQLLALQQHADKTNS